jgi:ELWxxDGT repeat protein
MRWVVHLDRAATRLGGQLFSSQGSAGHLTAANCQGLLYFYGNISTQNVELWATNGTTTAAGTFLVQELGFGVDYSLGVAVPKSGNIGDLNVYKDELYFTASNTSSDGNMFGL